MWPDLVCAFARTVAPLVGADEREIPRSYNTPDSLVSIVGFQRMVELAERDQIAWCVWTAIGGGDDVMDVESKT
jgi:hypothetical protein